MVDQTVVGVTVPAGHCELQTHCAKPKDRIENAKHADSSSFFIKRWLVKVYQS